MSENKLYAVLLQAVAEKGCLNFAEYMNYALYYPNLGYYTKKDRPFGKDFVTAPMISPLLAIAIVGWLKAHRVSHVVEMGYGNGDLARQILERSSDIVEYHLYEQSPQKVSFTDDRCQEMTVIADFNGALIANELLDALPFRRFCWEGNRLKEFVVINQGGLKMDLVPVSVDILPNSISGALSCLDGPYVFEYSNYAHFFETVKDIKGPLLLIDYGYTHDYFHPDRMLGGMMCYQNNTSVPFSLKDPGSMDITTGVNWILFEELAEQYGFQVENFGPQSDFILSQQESTIGLADLPLLHEHEMGYYIKVMSLVRTN